MPDETSQTDSDYLWERRHKILYKAELSTLYHQKRERFFDIADKMAKAISVIGGSVSFGQVIANQSILKWILAAITISSAFSLVMSFSDKSRRHSELARNFKMLQSTILAVGERDFTEEQLTEWYAKAVSLEASEPPSLGSLVILCQNEIARAQGHSELIKSLSLWRRMTAHFLDSAA